jgi:hypothetical protein
MDSRTRIVVWCLIAAPFGPAAAPRRMGAPRRLRHIRVAYESYRSKVRVSLLMHQNFHDVFNTKKSELRPPARSRLSLAKRRA